MQRLEVSGAVRPIYGSLGVKRLRIANRKQGDGEGACPSRGTGCGGQRPQVEACSMYVYLFSLTRN